MKIDPIIREKLGYNSELTDNQVLNDIRAKKRFVCKPCWELKYCPYGPIVEDFPLLPWGRQRSIQDNEKAIKSLKEKIWFNGKPLTEDQEKLLKTQIDEFEPQDHPVIPPDIQELECKVFGHICPVFFSAEAFTETKERRNHSRSIPRNVMIKVVRRDGQICQKCGEVVLDSEIEFDHIIPFSKGGKSTVENLRVVHKECNRKKSNSISEFLHPQPIQQYWELMNKKVEKPIKRKNKGSTS